MLVRRTEPVAVRVRGPRLSLRLGVGRVPQPRHARRRAAARPGLVESGRLPAPIFSPATKAESGHDENVPPTAVGAALGADVAAELRDASFALYAAGRDHAATRGIIIADTKFEFGFDAAGTLRLIDEVLTPDSSRFWPADRYAAGGPQPSFDKQPLRDYLALLKARGSLERRRAAAAAPAGGGRGDELPLPRSLPAAHRRRAGGVLMRFAPEGRWFIVGAWLVVAALALAGLRVGAAVAAVLALWVMWFFRDPERRWGSGDELILAPADGKVVGIVETDEPAFLGGLAIRISIFMNVFDCHVNRYPVGGTRRVPVLQSRQVPERGRRKGEPRQRAVVGGPRHPPRPRAGPPDRRPHRAAHRHRSRRRDRRRARGSGSG